MGFYGKYVLPKLIETACSQKSMTQLREQYVSLATGDVLEIGIGSGLNLPHYSSAVTSVTGLDPAVELTTLARKRAEAVSAPVEILEVSGEDIPADDNCYDSVVCTWTLCSIPNVYAALREIRRVLKPGGSFYFIEHGRAPDPKIIRWQHRLEPLWKKIGGGCHLSRRADELICDAGFGLTTCATGYEPGPKFAAFMIHGIARKI
ncbi:MAG: class I SAM-dependent methyltransferase [Gammaproteobacteria bacterium]|nr:class I SAM-dependent methyltransferase [Gammaproteobacteria bacterium]